MSEPPDWAISVPSHPGIHNEPARNYQWEQLTQDQLRILRGKMIEMVLQIVTQALRGLFVPTGDLSDSFDQLKDWADHLFDDHPEVDAFVESITGIIAGTLEDLEQFFEDLKAWMGNPFGMGTGSFDLNQAILDFINDLLNPTQAVQTPVWNIFDDIGETVQDWLDGLWGALTGTSGSTTPSAITNAQTAELVATVAAHSAAIAALKSTQTGGDNSGVSGGDEFGRVDTNDLGGSSFWAETYLSGSSADGFMAITDGKQAAWVIGNNVNREGRFRCTIPAIATTQTDYQQVILVTGTQLGGYNFFSADHPSLKIMCRMNTAGTQYVFARIRRTGDSTGDVQFGFRNGGNEILADTAVSVRQATGQTYALVAGVGATPRLFQLYRNDTLVHTWNDAGSLTALGANNRQWGFGAAAKELFGIGQIKPATVARIVIADNQPPATVGVVAEVYRNSTSNTAATLGGNGDRTLPPNTFDATRRITAGITFTPISNRFTIDSTTGFAGTYLFQFGLSSDTLGTSVFHHVFVYVNGVVDKRAGSLQFDQAGPAGDKRWQGSFIVYLEPGDQIEPGMNQSGGTAWPNFRGEGTGSSTWMSLTLLNKSTI